MMHQDPGAEAAFAVHRGPTSTDAPRPVPAMRGPSRRGAAPAATSAEDVSRHRNTAAGDLAFLTRYAFGGY